MLEETPDTYAKLIELDREHFEDGQAFGILWMSSKHRGSILREIRRLRGFAPTQINSEQDEKAASADV